MSKMNRSVWITVGVALLLGLALAATALAAGQNRGQRQRPERGEGMLHRVVLGEITGISGDSLTVKPELPQELLDRLAEHGVDVPELPDSITLVINDDSKLMLAGEPAELGSFEKGAKIIAFCEVSDDPVHRVVLRLTDEESARKFMEGRREFTGRGEPGMPPGGPGMMGRGDDGDLRDHMRPVFGQITKLSDDEVTIMIEIPDFIVERMAECGRELPDNLPSEVTLKYGDRTRFIVESEPVDEMPFKVGDTVAAMGIKLDDLLAAVVISDLESAKARMEQGGPGGPGMGPMPADGDESSRPRKRHRR